MIYWPTRDELAVPIQGDSDQALWAFWFQYCVNASILPLGVLIKYRADVHVEMIKSLLPWPTNVFNEPVNTGGHLLKSDRRCGDDSDSRHGTPLGRREQQSG